VEYIRIKDELVASARWLCEAVEEEEEEEEDGWERKAASIISSLKPMICRDGSAVARE
jgi:hypothetical protein